ncbi:MAG: porin family protein [Gammaproteobacteria bacterium]
MYKIIAVLSLLLVVSPTYAQGLDAKQIYFGGGIGLNDADFGDDATGFQLFAGIPLPVKMNKGTLSAEIGYMDSGDFEQTVPFFGTVTADAKGFWGTAVVSFPLQDNIDVLGRLGLDIGDDDGLMFGAGVGFKIAEKMDVRVEYVIRDNIDSLQANLVIRQ